MFVLFSHVELLMSVGAIIITRKYISPWPKHAKCYSRQIMFNATFLGAKWAVRK